MPVGLGDPPYYTFCSSVLLLLFSQNYSISGPAFHVEKASIGAAVRGTLEAVMLWASSCAGSLFVSVGY